MKHHRIILLRRKTLGNISHLRHRFVGGALLLKQTQKHAVKEQQKQNKIINVEPARKTLKLKL